MRNVQGTAPVSAIDSARCLHEAGFQSPVKNLLIYTELKLH